MTYEQIMAAMAAKAPKPGGPPDDAPPLAAADGGYDMLASAPDVPQETVDHRGRLSTIAAFVRLYVG